MKHGLYTERASQFAGVLSAHGIDAFFAHHPVTMSYLSGVGEDAHERFLTIAYSKTGAVSVICPSLSEAQIVRSGLTNVRSWKDGEDPVALFKDLASEWDLSTAKLAVDDTLPAHMLLQMQAALPKAHYRPGSPFVASLMRNKTANELDLLKKAGKIADDAFQAILPKIRPGMTEKALERIINEAMADRGGVPTFCIVGTGANGAEPHHLSDDTHIMEGDVIILDFGCSVEGYQSDITRTVSLGQADSEAKKVYEVVYKSHMAARATIAPGVSCSEVDAAARKAITDEGYGDRFVHRTGHGIGMNGHEAPYISGDNNELLAVGNCFSIEPGVYLTGKFGVRIENIVACSEGGHESLNAEPSPTLLSLTV
jgi:Xaa-Pro aminopeptidase